MIHIFHQIQGFKDVAHGAGANKNKEDFHAVVSPILNFEFTNSQILLRRFFMIEPNQSGYSLISYWSKIHETFKFRIRIW